VEVGHSARRNNFLPEAREHAVTIGLIIKVLIALRQYQESACGECHAEIARYVPTPPLEWFESDYIAGCQHAALMAALKDCRDEYDASAIHGRDELCQSNTGYFVFALR
jgi:hypothetical protein